MRFLLLVLAWALPTFGLAAVELVGQPSVETTATNVTLRWKTDSATGTRVHVTPPLATAPHTPSGTSADHYAVLNGLKAGTTYSVAIGTARFWLATNLVTAPGLLPGTVPRPGPAIGDSHFGTAPAPKEAKAVSAPPTRKIWGNLPSLQDHFERHGPDFGAKTPDDYARLVWEFLQRGKAGAPYLAKVDDDGVLRLFDPKTGSFAAYNRDGSAKTFFKPNSRDYFDRQPGKSINLTQWK